MDAIFVIVITLAILVFGVSFIFSDVKNRFELDDLLATGTRVAGKLVEVGTGSPAGRSNHTRYYTQPITFQFTGPQGDQTVKTQVVVPEMLQALLQAGAPCEAIIDPSLPSRLCLVSISNAFGVKTAVTLGTQYSRW